MDHWRSLTQFTVALLALAAAASAYAQDGEALKPCPDARVPDLRPVPISREDCARQKKNFDDFFKPAPVAAPAEQPKAPRGTHQWSTRAGLMFGYPHGASEVERANGVTEGGTLFVYLLSSRGGLYQFQTNSPTMVMRCAEPCTKMIVQVPGDSFPAEQIIPVQRGTVFAAIVEDARNGWLAQR